MLQMLERTYIAIFRRYPMLLRMALVVLLAEIVFAIVNNFALSFYIHDDLHLPMTVAGSIISVFLAAEMLLKFPAGHLSDRYGRRRFTAWGMAACIGTPLAVWLVPPAVFITTPMLLYFILVPLRITDGAGSACLWPPLFASVPDHIPAEKRGVAMSVVNTAYLVGLALGPALAGVAMKVSTAAGHPAFAGRAPFALSVVLALAAAVMAWTLPAQKSLDEEDGQAPPVGSVFPPLRVITIVLAITFADMFATATLAPYIGPYLSNVYHIDKSNVGFLMLLIMVPAGLLGMPIGHLTDRLPKRRVVQIALFATALGLWAVPMVHTPAHLVLAGVLILFGFMFGLPAWLSLITDLAPEAGHGKIMGAMAAAQGAGAFLGPYIGGRLWDTHFTHTYRLHLPGLARPWPITVTNEREAFLFFAAGAMITLSALIALIFIRGRGEVVRVGAAAGSGGERNHDF